MKLKDFIKEEVDQTADGIGNETYDIAANLSSTFESNIQNYLPTAKSVKASKGVVFISGKFNNDDETMSLIQMAISAELDKDGLNKFDITPKILPNKIIITFVRKN